MAGTEELMSRLQALEDGYYGDKEAERQKKFFDTYGDRFSNDQSFGMAILNELDARGIDTSAADEAVQELITGVASDCRRILTLITDKVKEVKDLKDTIDTIKDVVDDKVASNPDSTKDVDDLTADTDANPEGGNMPPADAGAMPPPDMPPADAGAMPPDAGMPPADGGAMPPPPADAGAMPPPDAGMPPAGGGAMPPPDMPPGTTMSDKRAKHIRKAYSRAYAKHSKPAGFAPSAGILSACMGGV